MYDAKATGMRIKMLRKQFGNSREEIAKRIGRSAKFYADIERGICGMSLDTLLDLADLYAVSLDYLVYGRENEQEAMDNREVWLVDKFGRLPKEKQKLVLDTVMLLEEGKGY